MKNRSWLRLTGWLLALIMILAVLPVATFAETDDEVESDTISSPKMQKRLEQVDIPASACTFADADGKAVIIADMDPNVTNYMNVTISNLDARRDIGDSTEMIISVPENIKIRGLNQFSNDAVNARQENNQLILSWKNGKQSSVSATFTVQPNVPADHDLSGTYALVTQTGVMVGSSAYSDGGRWKIKSISTKSAGEGKITPTVTERSYWTLKHISGDYYTVYSQIAGKYLALKSPNYATLTETNENAAQKIRVTKTSDGYYTFQYNGLGLNNSGNNASKGFASYTAGNANNEKFILYSPSSLVFVDVLKFSANGGTGASDPEAIFGEAGTAVTLPNLNATKSGQKFIGWADVNNIKNTVPDTKHTYHAIYKAGSSYTMKGGTETLYAVYNDTNTSVQFGIREDGVIQDEPNGYDTSNYKGHFTLQNVLKETHWIIDINSTKTVNDYYVSNDVTDNLIRVPTADEIKTALKKEGNIDFDPETQYVHWYVLKYAGKWKIDGVIRNKASVEITYNINAPAGTDKTKISNMPGSYQITSGTEILIGTEKNSQEIKTPTLKNHVFTGWNTEADGSGTAYTAGNYVRLKSNLNLYAQWADIERNPIITLESDWPQGKPALSGTKITLTAKLFGFDGLVEGEDYYLQWQHSLDTENWTDEPDANAITYTYELNSTTAQYSWRVVARSIQ